MDLIHLIYCSRSTDPELSTEHLEEILEQSRSNNSPANITGVLLYESGAFLQVLEGHGPDVESLYDKICKDARHTQVTKLISEAIEEREFGEWSMGYPRVTREELARIEGLNDFFTRGNSLFDLGEGRAKKLLSAFKEGHWHL